VRPNPPPRPCGAPVTGDYVSDGLTPVASRATSATAVIAPLIAPPPTALRPPTSGSFTLVSAPLFGAALSTSLLR